MLVVLLTGVLAGSAAAQAPTGVGGQRIGAQLIGKIEGPAVLTDPAMLPKQFHEAPMLAALVTQGKLPPVHARLPAEPLVIQPLHTIGTYGGT
jgi:peptide/nickel transport system substrate-binding protein